MTLKTRRILYFFFVLIFLITAPMVLLYTAGYRYNFSKMKLEKTGVLLLDSDPSGATIVINGRGQKQKTPAHISALLPDEYHVKVFKNDYLPWEKDLTIESEKSTFATGIFLPSSSSPLALDHIPADHASLSPSKKILLTRERIGSKVLFGFYDISQKKNLELGSIEMKDVPLHIAWSADSNIAIIQTESASLRFFIVSIRDGILYPITQFFENEVTTVKVDPNNKDTVIVGTRAGRFQFNTRTKTRQFLDTLSYIDYSLAGGLVYSLTQNGKEAMLVSEDQITRPRQIKKVVSLPFFDYRFLECPDSFITLQRPNGDMIVVELDTTPKIILQDQASGMSWFQSEGTWHILYIKDFELWNFDVATGSNQLITRLGTKIKQAVPLESGGHILFLSNNVMKLIEMDNRDKRNSWELAALDSLPDFAFDEKKQIIYFFGKKDSENEYTLYSRSLSK